MLPNKNSDNSNQQRRNHVNKLPIYETTKVFIGAISRMTSINSETSERIMKVYIIMIHIKFYFFGINGLNTKPIYNIDTKNISIPKPIIKSPLVTSRAVEVGDCS